MRGDVKVHEEPPVARVSSLFPEDGYGFIQTADNREIYFNENSIIKADFEQLQIGDSVRFNEVMGDKGPQASSVIVLK
jgi:cold shock CspA family protein